MDEKRSSFGAEFEDRLGEAVGLAERAIALARGLAQGLGTDEAALLENAGTCEAAIGDARDGVFDVAVVGEMNAGKSTLFNAMLLREELLPARVTVCTAKLTSISWAEGWSGIARFISREQWDSWCERAREYRAHPRNDESERGLADSLDRVRRDLGDDLVRLLGTARTFERGALADYASADGRFAPLVNEVNLTLPHPLGRRVRIVDTPGLFDPDRARHELTVTYLQRASVVVAALYAGQPMSRTDLELLGDHLVKAGLDRIIVALTKIDTVPRQDERRVVDYVDDKLRALRDAAGGSPSDRALLDALGKARAVPVSGILGLVACTKGKCTDGSFYETELSNRYDFSTYDEAWALSGLPGLLGEVEAAVLHRDGAGRIGAVLKKATALMGKVDDRLDDHLGRLRAAIEDRNRSNDELLRRIEELTNELGVMGSLRDPARRELGDVIVEARKEWLETRLPDKVASFAAKLREVGDSVVSQYGFFDFASSELTLRLQNNLLLAAEGFEREVRPILEGFGKQVSSGASGTLATILEGAADRITDRHVVERVRHARNTPVPELEALGLVDITPPSGWTTAFKPGKARETLRAGLRAAIEDWKKAALGAVKKTAAAYDQAIQNQYFEPALAELGRAVEARRADLRAAKAANEGSRGQAEAELAELRRRHEELGQTKATVRNLTAELLLASSGSASAP